MDKIKVSLIVGIRIVFLKVVHKLKPNDFVPL